MKSALARAGSVSKLRGPRSLSPSEGPPQKQTPKSVKFDKTDEVIHYDVMTPELTEEYWDQISLQSCDSDVVDHSEHDNRPLPALPQFVLPSTLLKREPSSPLQQSKNVIDSPIEEDEDDFDFNLQQRTKDPADMYNDDLPEPLQSPRLPEPVLNAPSMSTRIDAMLASSSGMSPSLRGTSGHRRTDSQMSDTSEASAPYLPLRSPQKYKPEEDEDDEVKWRDSSASVVARQDSLLDNQRHPPTLKVSDGDLPPPVDLDRTYSKRRKELATMLDPRTSSTAHSVEPIAEEAEESDAVVPPPHEHDESGLNEEASSIEEENPQRLRPLSERPSPPAHDHEVTPLLSDDSQFIASQSSIPQSSSEVLQNDFDFGNDAFWKGDCLNNLPDGTREGKSQDDSQDVNDTSNALSNEPAAQFAAGISPTLPEYTEDEGYEIREEPSSSQRVLPDEPQTHLHDAFNFADDSGENPNDVPMTREQSYLSSKDIRAEDLDVGPTLAPVRDDSDLFSLPSSPERNIQVAERTRQVADESNNSGYDENNPEFGDQSTPQKASLPEAPMSEEYSAAADHPETKRLSDLSLATAPQDINDTKFPVESQSEIHSKSPISRNTPDTPIKAETNVPRVKVLPWDPSVEDFQTSPIPVPDRSPERQRSPQRGLNSKTGIITTDDFTSSGPYQESQFSSSQHDEMSNDEDTIDSELQELMHSTSQHSSIVQNPDEPEDMHVLLGDYKSSMDILGVTNDVPPKDGPSKDSFNTSMDPNVDSNNDQSNDVNGARSEPVNNDMERPRNPSVPTTAPTLSPVAFSPFVASLPSSPAVNSPVVNSLKEPMTEITTAGIDELVASPVVDQAERLSIPSLNSLSSQLSADVKAKSEEPHGSDESVSGGRPHLDSDLSDFEASPEIREERAEEGTIRPPALDNQSTWESISSRSPTASGFSSSLHQLHGANSPEPQLPESISSPPEPSESQQMTHVSHPSLTGDVSLREPSFGESMSSTLQQMLSQRSELGTDSTDRSYTLREHERYVVATGPTRPQIRSQAFEIVRDDSSSAYSTQLVIPRNRSLPTHSSLDQNQLRQRKAITDSQDSMRAPSFISRTDSSSYSLVNNSLSSQSYLSYNAKGKNPGRATSESKLGPIFEPENDLAESSSTAPELAAGDHKLPPIIEPSLSESEDSMIAISSSKTGHEIRMLDHSLIQEQTNASDTPAKLSTDITKAPFASSEQYRPTIFPKGVLFLVVKGIKLMKQVPRDTLVTLTLDNGVHSVTSAARKLSEISDFAEEYRIGILEAPLIITLRLCSPVGPVQASELELGADGSFAKLDVGNLRTQVFGKRCDLTLLGINQWSTSGSMSVCTVDVATMYIPCVSHKERLPNRLNDAMERINEARGLLRERQARMQGVLRQFGGDVTRHRGKQRWFVLDSVAPLLVAHSLRSHKARTLINLAKATSTAQVDTHKLEIRFRNQEVLTFQVQSTLELAAWIRALRGCIGSDQNLRPKWIDAVIYESENGALSA